MTSFPKLAHKEMMQQGLNKEHRHTVHFAYAQKKKERKSFLCANKPRKKKVDEVFRCESHRSSPATLGEGGRVREAAK